MARRHTRSAPCHPSVHGGSMRHPMRSAPSMRQPKCAVRRIHARRFGKHILLGGTGHAQGQSYRPKGRERAARVLAQLVRHQQRNRMRWRWSRATAHGSLLCPMWPTLRELCQYSPQHMRNCRPRLPLKSGSVSSATAGTAGGLTGASVSAVAMAAGSVACIVATVRTSLADLVFHTRTTPSSPPVTTKESHGDCARAVSILRARG